CGHLSEWMRFPLDGFPRPPILMRCVFWLTRPLARLMLRRVLEKRAMPGGGRTIDATVPAPGGDESAAVEQLRQTITRFRARAGPFHPSPLFGTPDREDA